MSLLVLICLAAFFTSSVTATMGIGGGVILLALLAQWVSPQLLIPLHGAAQVLSNINRVVVQREHIDWAYIKPFTIGGILGAALITPVAFWVPQQWGMVALGLFILVATWRPAWLKLQSWAAWASGGVTTGLSMVLGATGPLVMSVLPKQWNRMTVVGTHAMAMVVQHGLKLIAFSSMNVALWEHWDLLLGLTLSTMLGNQIGAKLLGRLPEHWFKVGLDWLLTLLAINLIWEGLSGP
ncbi:MAG: sulfite exporter TauE/SafE family protein [Limnobacter sp.]|uniref:sulfite exporter TauE/SafE family protein n=1 Tax=Limnobacter sp. TaxID=2003368 RepID=UPI0039192262